MRKALILFILAILAIGCRCPRVGVVPAPKVVQVPGIKFDLAPMPSTLFLRDTIVQFRDSITKGKVRLIVEDSIVSGEVQCPDAEVIVQPEPYPVEKKVLNWPLIVLIGLAVGLSLYRILR